MIRIRNKRPVAVLLLLAVVMISVCFLAPHVLALGSKKSKELTQNRPDAWMIRCGPETKDNSPRACEMAQQLTVKKTGQRVAEFAIGFPGGDRRNARGVVILPLGILLTDDVQMKIGESEKVKFKVRYCAMEGCVAFLTLNKSLLQALGTEDNAMIITKASDGKDVNIAFSLAGFSKTLDRLNP